MSSWAAGFDAAIAKKNGYQIRTDASGREYSVKTGASSNATPAALDEVCGDSYIEYYRLGNKQAVVYSGWDLSGSYIGTFFA